VRELKIVHLITNLQVGGAEMMLLKLLSHMDRQRFRSVVVPLVAVGSVGKKIQELDIPVYALGMRRGRPSAQALSAIFSLLKQERPFIVQTWLYHADLLGLVAGSLARVPHVVWNVRCSNMEQLSRGTDWTLKICAKLSARPSVVVVNSEAGKAVHASLGYHPRQWMVIPNGFDLNRFAPDPAARDSVRAELGLGSDTPLIGLVGRYNPMKDHETFLRAAMHLAKDQPDIHFLLAGAGVAPTNADLCRVIAGHAIQKQVHLLGERMDIPRLMAGLDILTCSSIGEGFPNVVGEAMACEVPCVVTDVGDVARIVGDTGIVVPRRDPAAMASAWKLLLSAGADVRHALGRTARQRVEQNYSLERVVRDYEDLYLSLKGA
jgi:glycosyltransferase involved in cell wall biosynthesis